MIVLGIRLRPPLPLGSFFLRLAYFLTVLQTYLQSRLPNPFFIFNIPFSLAGCKNLNFLLQNSNDTRGEARYFPMR